MDDFQISFIIFLIEYSFRSVHEWWLLICWCKNDFHRTSQTAQKQDGGYQSPVRGYQILTFGKHLNLKGLNNLELILIWSLIIRIYIYCKR